MSISDLSQYKQEYLVRVNRVIDYIDQNLAKPLTLEELADIANFSPYHFHRIFSAMVGETLSSYIKRLRLELAASRLVLSIRLSVTQIALDCGFANSSIFAREFKKFFQLTPSAYRNKYQHLYKSKDRQGQRKNRQTKSKPGQVFSSTSHYIDEQVLTERRKTMSLKPSSIKVKKMPEMTVAYYSHTGDYNDIGPVFKKIANWAQERDLFEKPNTLVLGIYPDDPKVTEVDKLRSRACVTIPADMDATGTDGKTIIPAGKYVVARFEIDPSQFGEAWDYVMGEWLPTSGYQPDDRPCFELYINDAKSHPEGKFIVEICEPIKPM